MQNNTSTKSHKNLAKDVIITEVGPRDGLQNEVKFVDTKTKLEFIELLSNTGLKNIEVTSFVSSKSVPQLADHEILCAEIPNNDINYSVLIPNEQGMNKLLQTKIKNIALFTAASEAFNEKNINCSIKDSIERFKPVMELSQTYNINVRAYISCVIACPYEGNILPEKVAMLSQKLLNLGVKEISFGDTIGVGTPKHIVSLLNRLKDIMPLDKISMHFHDTYGQAIANTYASLEEGVFKFDSCVAGLGGCPYALGATGNMATEDLLYLLQGLGINTGIDLYKIIQAGDFICKYLGKNNNSKVANALMKKINLNN